KTSDTRQLPNACQRSDASTGRPVARHGQRRVGPPFNARHRDRLAARQPADNRSPIRSRQAIEDVTCGPRAAGIAAILGKPLFSKDQMRLFHLEVGCDADDKARKPTTTIGAWGHPMTFPARVQETRCGTTPRLRPCEEGGKVPS